MLLVVDVGNTNTVFGLVAPHGALESIWRISSHRDRMPDEWYALLDPRWRSETSNGREIDAAIVATVVPSIGRALVTMLRERLGIDPMLVSTALDLGISIDVDTPNEVGADRLVNAAYASATIGAPVIVIDLGTATKLEAVAAGGVYKGGAIAPGLQLTLEALASRAARLYAVELQMPASILGRNTVEAVQAGVVAGHFAMIEGLVERTKAEIGGSAQIVMTGGLGHVANGHLAFPAPFDPDLTLKGLHYLYERNR